MAQTTSIICLLLLGTIVSTIDAISKKSDDPSVNQSVHPQMGSGQNGQYSPMASHPYSPNHDHSDQSQQLQSGSQSSNLYYYYYPVQDKQKDQTYHSVSASGQHQQQLSHDNVDQNSMDAAASGSEISYSAPDLGHDYQAQAQSFDAQTLSNLASQFQQQYYNNAQNNYDPNSAALGYGSQADASAHIASQVHPGYQGQLGPQGSFAFAPQGSPYGQHIFPNYGSNGQAIQPQNTEVSGIASGLKKYGLGSILMPVLAIAGLSLLLPTVTSLGTTTTKTKRSIEDSPLSSYIEKMDAYYKMYNKAMEKEECMNRMICELGSVYFIY